MKNKKNAKKLFYKFLKEEGIWYLYWYNVLLGQKNGWNYKKIDIPKDYISDAFDWNISNIFSLSNEKYYKKCMFYNNEYYFWGNIDAKWRRFYEKNK